MIHRALIGLMLAACIMGIGCRPRETTPQTQAQRVLPPSVDVPESPEENPALLADINALQISVQTEPDDVFVRFQYLTALDRAGRYDEALDQARTLGAVQENNPYRAAAYLNFAHIVLDKISPDDPRRPELVSEAIQDIQVALADEPGSVPSHLALGRLALGVGDKDSALHQLAITLAASEIGYQLRMRMAEIYIERGDFAKARAHLEAAKPLAQAANDRQAVRQINRLLSQTG